SARTPRCGRWACSPPPWAWAPACSSRWSWWPCRTGCPRRTWAWRAACSPSSARSAAPWAPSPSAPSPSASARWRTPSAPPTWSSRACCWPAPCYRWRPALRPLPPGGDQRAGSPPLLREEDGPAVPATPSEPLLQVVEYGLHGRPAEPDAVRVEPRLVGELSLWVNVVPEITDPVHEVLGVEFDQLLVMHHFDQIMQADLLRLYRFAFAWGETLGPRLPFAFFQDRQQQPFHEAANADDRKGVGAIALAE